jgi:hypothetical protein
VPRSPESLCEREGSIILILGLSRGLPWPCSNARTVLSCTGAAAARRRLSLCPVQADRSSILRTAMTDTRIVTTAYRYKPPPRKRKAVAIAGPAIVRKRGRADAAVPPPAEPEPPAPSPAPAAKPAIATSISRKRTKFCAPSRQRSRSPTTPRRAPRCGHGSSARNGAAGRDEG